MYKILIASARKRLRAKLEDCLFKAGYELLEASTKENALQAFNNSEPNLVLVDVRIQEGKGLELCSQLRELSDVPIVLILNKGEREIGIKSLEECTDDFFMPYLDTREILARIKAALRRIPPPAEILEKGTVAFDNLNIDMEKQQVIVFGRSISLTAKERELLWLLASHPNVVFSRSQLFQQVWGKVPCEDMRTVDTHIKKLRHKLNAPLDSMWSIATVWSIGYKFVIVQ